MSFEKRFEISIVVALIFTTLFSIFSFAESSENIRNEVLRLHVIANSDSDADQKLKLEVRDALLLKGADIFDGSVNIQNAKDKIIPCIKNLTQTAEKIIREKGYDYDVLITLSEEYFATRTYETITLPAGEYLALRVVIGKGEGHNWWCVMFPPMCLSAADKKDELAKVLGKDGMKLVLENPKFEPRFRILELYEDFKHRVRDYIK